jgi:hypothetical protein
MNTKNFRRGAALCGVITFTAFASLAFAEPASRWRIEFDHWAEGDGDLVLRIAPLDGAPLDVTAKVPKDMSENEVARLVTGALKAQLGKAYKVEVDDGEDVLIKRAGKTPKFEVSLVSSSVTGLNIKIGKD